MTGIRGRVWAAFFSKVVLESKGRKRLWCGSKAGGRSRPGSFPRTSEAMPESPDPISDRSCSGSCCWT